MENAGIFHGRLEFLTVIRYFMYMYVHILWPFSNVVVIWYIFPRLGLLCQEKSGNPADSQGSSSLLLMAINGGKR
jgi:hypothetical protein